MKGIQEFKRQTLNRLRNLEMMQCCWNKLRKRTADWAKIRMTIEDQLSVHRNWNLHPRNPNSDMTSLKDGYRSGEESHLGSSGQVRMEVNTVTALVMSALVIYAATSKAPTLTVLVIDDCKDSLNTLGNCYVCNKPRHVK